jgi:drug/metabolite transporter (DMT)-like permease
MVLITVACTVYGQFVIKYQVVKAGSMPEAGLGRIQFMLRLLLDPWIISAFAAAVIASLTWIAAMTRLPLSEAYPVTSITFLCVVFGGAWLFAEPMPPQRIVGTLLVVAGLVVGSRS